jgi:hypothetical protein
VIPSPASRLLLIICLPLLLSACGDSDEVKQLRALRRSGDVQKAFDLAVVHLGYGSHRMDIWRELVYTDLEIARLERSSGDPLPNLVRAAVASAAMRAFKKEPGELWKSAVPLAASQMIAQSQRMIGQIDDSRKHLINMHDRDAEEDRRYENLSEDERLSALKDYERYYLRSGTPSLVDPALAHQIVYTSACYYELLKLLRTPDDHNIAEALRFIDDSLNDWPNYSELDLSYIEDVRAEARADIEILYQAALDDLRAHRHFTLEHLLHPELRP